MTQGPLEDREKLQLAAILEAWSAIGEDLFADGERIIVPKLGIARSRAELFAIEVALIKHDGNITRAGRDLDTSRRALRDKLKQASMYPWDPRGSRKGG